MKSRFEVLFVEKMQEILKTTYIQNHRPNFMKNDATGANYEIDLYLPSFKLGFEFQGSIHFKRDEKRVIDLKKQKIIERRYWSKNSIIEVFESDLTEDFKEHIIDRILSLQELYFYQKRIVKCIHLEQLYLVLKFGNPEYTYLVKENAVFYSKPDSPSKMHLFSGEYKTLKFLNFLTKITQNKEPFKHKQHIVKTRFAELEIKDDRNIFQLDMILNFIHGNFSYTY